MFEPGEKSLKAAKNCSTAIMILSAVSIVSVLIDLFWQEGAPAQLLSDDFGRSLLMTVVVMTIFFDLIRIAFALWGRTLAARGKTALAFNLICFTILGASLMLAIAAFTGGQNAGRVLSNAAISVLAYCFMRSVRGVSKGMRKR